MRKIVLLCVYACVSVPVRACPFMVFMERGIETFFLPPGAAAVMQMGQKKSFYISTFLSVEVKSPNV